jgi:hypothetical protein
MTICQEGFAGKIDIFQTYGFRLFYGGYFYGELALPISLKRLVFGTNADDSEIIEPIRKHLENEVPEGFGEI